MSAAEPLDPARLQAIFDGIAAEYVARLNLRIDEVGPGSVVLTLPMAAGLVHGGGVLCGQAMLSAADTALLLAMIAQLGEFRPMTTVQLQTSFLRPVPQETAAIILTARILRAGRNLSYGEVEFKLPDGKLVAHATSTYSLL